MKLAGKIEPYFDALENEYISEKKRYSYRMIHFYIQLNPLRTVAQILVQSIDTW